MHRIVVLKVYEDVVYRNAGRVTIGIFNRDGELVETKVLPGFMFVQTKENPIREQQELKLIPIEAVESV